MTWASRGREIKNSRRIRKMPGQRRNRKRGKKKVYLGSTGTHQNHIGDGRGKQNNLGAEPGKEDIWGTGFRIKERKRCRGWNEQRKPEKKTFKLSRKK